MGTASGLVFFAKAEGLQESDLWALACSIMVIVLGSMACVLSPPSESRAASMGTGTDERGVHVHVPPDSDFSTSSIQGHVGTALAGTSSGRISPEPDEREYDGPRT